MVAQPTSRYRELAPPLALEPYVTCLWVHSIGEGEATYAQPVLPDGCIDVVAVEHELVLAGPATRSTTLHLAPGTVTVGVRFRTGAAPALLGTSAAELRDRDTRPDELWGRVGDELAARVAEPSNAAARLGVIVAALTKRVDTARVPDAVVAHVASLLECPDQHVAPLARAVGLSDRQLRRRVEEAVGYPPRTLARIQRFQRFLRATRASMPRRSLATLAAEAGYADQAHLTRESRTLTGLTPVALLDWEARRLAR